MSWQPAELGDVADLVYGPAFKSASFLDAESEGIKLVRGDNVQQGYIRWGDKTKKWPSEEYDAYSKYQLQIGDVILAMDRPIVGGGLKLAWIKEDDLPGLLVQRVCRIRGIEGKALTDHLRYALSAPAFSAHVEKITTGANIPHISGKDISAYKFALPSLEEQRQIIAFLRSYDDLITNNQRRILLLEESARCLYREWFVHLRFPGYEQVLVEDSVPEGWQSGYAHDFLDVMSGGTPKTSVEHYWNGVIGFFTPKDAPNGIYVYATDKTITEEGLSSCNSRLFPKETIFITARGTVGKIALAQTPMAMNQSCYALKAKDELEINNLWLFLAIQSAVEHFKQSASEGVFRSIVVNTFKTIPFVYPRPEITQQFGDLLRPVFDQLEALMVQNTYLRQARDQLLPRLMSGQLDINSLETTSNNEEE